MERTASVPGNISGRVTASDTSVWVPYAHVTIVCADNTSIIYDESTADLNGYYHFSRVNTTWHNGQLAATYKIHASNGHGADGYSESFGLGEKEVNVSCIIRNPETTAWFKTYADSRNVVINSVHPAIDDGYIIAGHIQVPRVDDRDIYLAKTDASGNLLWNRTYWSDDVKSAGAVLPTADGGYIVAGNKGFRVESDVFKVNEVGERVWGLEESLRYKKPAYIGPRDNDSYFLAGWLANGGTYVAIVDERGSLRQVSNYKDINLVGGEQSVSPTSDGGLVLVGLRYSADRIGPGIILLKIDAGGNVQFERLFGEQRKNYGYAVMQTADEGYMIVGQTVFSDDSGDVYAINTDPAGNMIWSKEYRVNGLDRGTAVRQARDGGYLIGGNTYDNSFLIRTDKAGNQLWQHRMGRGSEVNALIKPSNDSYLVAGLIGSEGFLARVPEKVLVYDRTINEGEPYSDAVWTTAEDFGRGRATVDYGDGTSAEVNGVRTAFVIPVHRYADEGAYTINVTVTNIDSYPGTTVITVKNVAPVDISMSGTTTAYRGEPFAREMTFTDPGNDSWSAYIDYGDGANATIGSVSRTFSLPAHTYATNGNYTITALITDDDGATGMGSTTISVSDKPLLLVLTSLPAIAVYAIIVAVLVLGAMIYRKNKK